MYRFVECVVAVAEGRDAALLAELEAALEEPGLALLLRDVDERNGRTVMTLVGAGEAVRRAVVRCARKAIERIDVTAGRSAWPVRGAVDGVWIRPLAGGADLEACRALADAIRAAIADRTGEAVRVEACEPSTTVHLVLEGAGEAAHRIAAQLGEDARIERSLCFPTGDDRTSQLSVDVRATRDDSIATILESITAAAAAAGLRVIERRIVGAVRRDALAAVLGDAATGPGRPEERILEDLVERCGVRDFPQRLGSAFPVPGGGAAAARAGHLAARLAEKVIRVSLRSKSSLPIRDRLEPLLDAALRAARRFEQLDDEDQAAFHDLLEAMRSPRRTEEERAARDAAMARAATRAVLAPVETMETVVETLDILDHLTGHATEGHVRAESDLGAAAELARSVFTAVEWNVRANLPFLGDSPSPDDITTRVESLRQQMETTYAATVERLRGIVDR